MDPTPEEIDHYRSWRGAASWRASRRRQSRSHRPALPDPPSARRRGAGRGHLFRVGVAGARPRPRTGSGPASARRAVGWPPRPPRSRSAAAAGAAASGQCSTTSSCWKKTSSAPGAPPSSSRRRSAASITAAQSAALACTTKLRVKRPRSRAVCRARACSGVAGARQRRPFLRLAPADDGGGQVRPRRERTSRPASPSRAAASTYADRRGEAPTQHAQHRRSVSAGRAVERAEHRDLRPGPVAAEGVGGERGVEIASPRPPAPSARRRPAPRGCAAPAGRRRPPPARARIGDHRPPHRVRDLQRAAATAGPASGDHAADHPVGPEPTVAAPRCRARTSRCAAYSRASSLYSSSGATAGWSSRRSTPDRAELIGMPARVKAWTTSAGESGLTRSTVERLRDPVGQLDEPTRRQASRRPRTQQIGQQRVVHVRPPRHAGPGHLGRDQAAGRLGGDQQAHPVGRAATAATPQLVGVHGDRGVDARRRRRAARRLRPRTGTAGPAASAGRGPPVPASRPGAPRQRPASGTRPIGRRGPAGGPRSAPGRRTGRGRRPRPAARGRHARRTAAPSATRRHALRAATAAGR